MNKKKESFNLSNKQRNSFYFLQPEPLLLNLAGFLHFKSILYQVFTTGASK